MKMRSFKTDGAQLLAEGEQVVGISWHNFQLSGIEALIKAGSPIRALKLSSDRNATLPNLRPLKNCLRGLDLRALSVTLPPFDWSGFQRLRFLSLQHLDLRHAPDLLLPPHLRTLQLSGYLCRLVVPPSVTTLRLHEFATRTGAELLIQNAALLRNVSLLNVHLEPAAFSAMVRLESLEYGGTDFESVAAAALKIPSVPAVLLKNIGRNSSMQYMLLWRECSRNGRCRLPNQPAVQAAAEEGGDIRCTRTVLENNL